MSFQIWRVDENRGEHVRLLSQKFSITNPITVVADTSLTVKYMDPCELVLMQFFV